MTILFLFLFNILQAWLTKQDYGNKTEVRKTEQETKWKK